MNKLRAKFTLPALQAQLDNLAEGALLQISGWDYERLFGTNDVAATRLRNFATSHACVASHGDRVILFRKQLARREGNECSSPATIT
jgi:hypothetical protein